MKALFDKLADVIVMMFCALYFFILLSGVWLASFWSIVVTLFIGTGLASLLNRLYHIFEDDDITPPVKPC